MKKRISSVKVGSILAATTVFSGVGSNVVFASSAAAAGCPIPGGAFPQETVWNNGPGANGHQGVYSEMRRLTQDFSTPGCDYGIGRPLVQVSHFSGSGYGCCNQIETGMVYMKSGNEYWYKMFVEEQFGNLPVTFNYDYSPSNHGGGAPCNQPADGGFSAYKVVYDGGNVTRGYDYHFAVDCEDGSGLHTLASITGESYKTGVDESEFEIQSTGMAQVAYYQSLQGLRTDGHWEAWGGLGCAGHANMTNNAFALSANSYFLTNSPGTVC